MKISEVWARVKAAMPYPQSGMAGAYGFYNNLFSLMPGSNIDYGREVGPLWKNNIVHSCLSWQARTFPEAPPVVYIKGSQNKEDRIVDDHPLIQVLQNPNDFFTSTEIFDAILLSMMLDGNAYLFKRRAPNSDLVVGLDWLPHWLVEPRATDPTKPVTSYEYRPVAESFFIPPSEIVHIRYGVPDPFNWRKSLGPLTSVLREISFDNHASTMSAALARNIGIPGVVMMPKTEGVQWTDTRAKKMKDEFMQRFAGDRRGEPYVLTTAVDINHFAFSPTDMDFTAMRRVPEARICAALGIPPVVMYFQVGMDKSTYNNVKMAYDAAWHSNIIPLQRRIADAINRQLLYEFGNLRKQKFGFDLTKVRYLQQDQTDVANRAATLYNSGIVKRWEAKRMVGEEFDLSADDIYKTDIAPMNGDQSVQPNLGNARNPMPSLDEAKAWEIVLESIGTYYDIPLNELRRVALPEPSVRS